MQSSRRRERSHAAPPAARSGSARDFKAGADEEASTVSETSASLIGEMGERRPAEKREAAQVK